MKKSNYGGPGNFSKLNKAQKYGSPGKANEHVGFAGMTEKLEKKGYSEDSAKKIAAKIGFEKYGKAGMEAKAAAARKK